MPAVSFVMFTLSNLFVASPVVHISCLYDFPEQWLRRSAPNLTFQTRCSLPIVLHRLQGAADALWDTAEQISDEAGFPYNNRFWGQGLPQGCASTALQRHHQSGGPVDLDQEDHTSTHTAVSAAPAML